MFGAGSFQVSGIRVSAHFQQVTSGLKRSGAVALLGAAALLLLACPAKKHQSTSIPDAERGLRLAININEVAYNSWNKVYENIGQLHRTGRISEARWAAVNAVDGVIVLSEADLIEGIERSKKLLSVWRNATVKVLSAESPEDVSLLRDRETEARRSFDNSIDFLNVRSVKLRDSYYEALTIANSVVRDGQPLPAEALSSIRNVISMVDEEIEKAKRDHSLARRATVQAPPTISPAPRSLNQPVPNPSPRPTLSSAQKSAPVTSRVRTVKTQAKN